MAGHEHVFFAPAHRNTALKLRGPDGNVHSVERSGRIAVNAINAVVDAVESGFGVHAGPRWAFQASIDAGKSVELLPDYDMPSLPMQAVWSPAVLLPARIRRCVDFMRQSVHSVPGLKPVGLM
ncbi:MAG: LysR substrate-binding domain-containing protein [Pseudomonadota bacterium]